MIPLITRFNQTFAAFTNCQDPSCDTHIPKVPASLDNLQTILQIVFAVIGAVALVFIILAGLQFVTSQGDPNSAAKARQTAIYAVIGLVVALSAEVIVTFVLGRI